MMHASAAGDSRSASATEADLARVPAWKAAASRRKWRCTCTTESAKTYIESTVVLMTNSRKVR